MNRWIAAFPKRYEQDVRVVKACLPFAWTRLSPGSIEMRLEQERIQIPTRLYLSEVDATNDVILPLHPSS